MNVKVAIEDSPEGKSVSESAGVFFVEQANAKAMINQKSYCRLVGNVVKALVPACLPSVTSQTPEASFATLAKCYESCINAAVSAGAKLIVVRPLGVGIKITKVSETGETVNAGLWGNLFWTHAKSSLAAKTAVINVCGFIPDDVTVVFEVPNDAWDDWDCAMEFSS